MGNQIQQLRVTMPTVQEYTLLIGGQAGQGIQTLGMLMSQMLMQQGLFISTYQSYQSRIRGGHNYFQIRISPQPIHSMKNTVHIVVALDDASLQAHCQELGENSVILYDASRLQPQGLCAPGLGLDIKTLFPLAQQEEVYATSVFAGALAQLLQLNTISMNDLIQKNLGKKSSQVIADNQAAFHAGIGFIQTQSTWDGHYRLMSVLPKEQALVMHGNQALALGAMQAGCKFFSAYPMSPSTSVFETMAGAAESAGLVVEQAEDEIAALNMVLGAAYAGVRAMTSTSGGGFALMVEAVSLAGMIECPAVIVNAQRPGPATGLPTRTEQGDLEMVVHAGHGEFPKAVFAPGNLSQCYGLAAHAFNVADYFQMPVIILTDQYLADLYQNLSLSQLALPPIERSLLVASTADYQRYQLTADGISPRAIPGKGEGLVVVDSDEHTEDGHLTEDLNVRVQMNAKRLEKCQGAQHAALMPDVYGTHTRYAVVCWGSTLGVCLDAAQVLETQGTPVSILHFQQVWPLPAEKLKSLLGSYQGLIAVENNATGQLARLIRAETSVEITQQVLKSNGMPFFLDELVSALQQHMQVV